MSQIVTCKCGATQGLFDKDGNVVCHACYNALVEAKNMAVHELFEARARISQLERELASMERRPAQHSNFEVGGGVSV